MAATLVLTAGGTGCTAESAPTKVTASHADATIDMGGEAAVKDTQNPSEYTLLTSAPMNFGAGKACSSDTDCPASFMPCYTAFCDKGKGVCNVKKIAAAVVCDDGNQCTQEDHCDNGKCSGASVPCDDGNPCTVDFCVAAQGCTHGNLEQPCQVDDVCTLHACKAGACEVVDTEPCNDGNPCTTDLCDQGKGCSYVALNAVACDDGDPCTDSEFCQFGKCANKGNSCNDSNPCTDDACDGKGDCLHTPNSKPCSDGKPCTVADTCAGGTCAGTPKQCADGMPCSQEYCDNLTGICAYAPAPTGAPCDDGNPCTASDSCANYACKGSELSCDDGNACTADSCAPSGGGCVNAPVVDGSACSASDPCIAGAICQLGECVGKAKDCDDANPCTIDACDAATGACLQTPLANGTACGDGGTCYTGACL